jgi:hypothetical protein
MAVTLEIHFTGLCAFVPKKAIDQDKNHATVLLVNARRSHHGAHHALLLAEPDVYPDVLVDIENRPAANRFQFLTSTFVTVKACVFSGEQIGIVGLKEDFTTRVVPLSDTLTFVHGLRQGAACPKFSGTPTKTDFDWVLTNPGKVNPALLTCFDCSDIVGMRMMLTSGVLRNDLFRQVDDRILKWHFGQQFSAAAEEVIYELTFADETGVKSVALESIPFAGSPSRDPLILTPPQQGGPIRAWIVNMPPGDLLRLADPLPYERDHHYEEYYRLCSDSPQPLIPFPDAIDSCQGVIAISNPKCPPTQFAPPADLAELAEMQHEHGGER